MKAKPYNRYPRIDTVQAKDCYDPADYILVHKDFLAKLRAKWLGKEEQETGKAGAEGER